MSNPAQCRFKIAMLMLWIAYMLVLFGVVAFFRDGSPTGISAYAAAILPALPIVGMFFAIARYLVEEKDEYLRMKMNRQVLVATALMLTVATIWGFLENFDLVQHIDSYWAAVVWFFGLSVGRLYNRYTIGDGGC
jgi:hypothetical protein